MKTLLINEGQNIIPITQLQQGKLGKVVYSYGGQRTDHIVMKIGGYVVDLNSGDFLSEFDITNITVSIIFKGSTITFEV